ncbi:hypothetical protein Tco_0216734 [Tanacetum coccineum]
MKDCICALSKNDLKDLVKTYHIPLDLHPGLPNLGFTIDRAYPTVTFFRVFQCLCKQGDWFSFSKCRNTEDICMDDGPSSLKKGEHSCLCVSDDLPSDGYDQNDVQRLRARLNCLCEMREEMLVHSRLSSVWFNKECDPVFRRVDDNAGRLGRMSIYDFMTLPSWSDAKIAKESHHLSLLLLERVPSHTTTPATEGAIIPLHTPDEISASLLDSSLSEAEGTDKADLADLCDEIEDSLERDEGVSMRAVSAPISRLGNRLCAPPSIAVVSASEPSHVGTSAPASTSGYELLSNWKCWEVPGLESYSESKGSTGLFGLYALSREPVPHHMPLPIRYKDAMDGLRDEVTQFVGYGVESIIQKLLSSDEFHAAHARVALWHNYVSRGALVDFPTKPFPFLSRIAAAFEGTLSDVAQILPDKFVRSATLVSVAPSSVNEAPEQVPP